MRAVPSLPARRSHESDDQPDRDHQHGAEQEVAPESDDDVKAHVPDVLEQLADAAEDVERIEPEDPQDKSDEDREQDQLDNHRRPPSAEEAAEGAWFILYAGHRTVLRRGHGHGAILS